MLVNTLHFRTPRRQGHVDRLIGDVKLMKTSGGLTVHGVQWTSYINPRKRDGNRRSFAPKMFAQIAHCFLC